MVQTQILQYHNTYAKFTFTNYVDVNTDIRVSEYLHLRLSLSKGSFSVT